MKQKIIKVNNNNKIKETIVETEDKQETQQTRTNALIKDDRRQHLHKLKDKANAGRGKEEKNKYK